MVEAIAVMKSIKLLFRRLSDGFLERYRASGSEFDLDDHRHFKQALGQVDAFLAARGSQRGFFHPFNDLDTAGKPSAAVQHVLSLLAD